MPRCPWYQDSADGNLNIIPGANRLLSTPGTSARFITGSEVMTLCHQYAPGGLDDTVTRATRATLTTRVVPDQLEGHPRVPGPTPRRSRGRRARRRRARRRLPAGLPARPWPAGRTLQEFSSQKPLDPVIRRAAPRLDTGSQARRLQPRRSRRGALLRPPHRRERQGRAAAEKLTGRDQPAPQRQGHHHRLNHHGPLPQARGRAEPPLR